jgi:predicted ATPase/DNA-binding SARP family transcriptional activator
VKPWSGRVPGPDRTAKLTGAPLARCVRVLDLGPLAVLADGEVREIPGRLPQTLLRVLAREPGRSVSVAALVDALWGENPPRRADAVIEQHVWRLRKVIEPDRRSGDPPRVLVRTAGGYALRVSAEDVDSVRQAALVDSGGEHLAAGRALAALECFAAAEALWRGSPAGLPSTGGEGWLARLDEVRLAAAKGAVDAELALGRTAGALARLDAARVELPFHEGLWERRMLALYRLGRQAEALAAFREIRDLLAAELGVDPGPGLRALHARILRQDPALLASARAGVAGQVGSGVLPAWLTSFVGREAEVASLARLLRQHRLVTVVGAGGTGKTRLAVETARVVAGEFPDGVAFADLVPATRPEAVAEAVLAALGAPGPAELADPAGVLSDLAMLVVLDNCEQVADGAAALAERVLRACPRVRLLATSRMPLGIGGEQLWDCEPLETAGVGDDGGAALNLFADRVRLVRPAFTVDDRTRALATRVVELLDGVPLAIELAAGRVRALGLAGLAGRLEEDVSVLSGGDRDTPHRHRSIAEVIDWSLRLAPPAEQILFRRLAVVPGGVTTAAAQRLATAAPLAADMMPELLDGLVRRSLLLSAEVGPVMRYRLLEPVRRHAETMLDAAAERGEVLDRLLGHALAVAAGRPRFGQIDDNGWYLRAEAEHAAFGAAASYGLAGTRVEDGAVLVARLNPFLTASLRSAEALRLTRWALDRVEPGTPLSAWLSGCQANIHINYGHVDEAAAGFSAAVSSLTEAGWTEPACELLVLGVTKLLFHAEDPGRAATLLGLAAGIGDADPHWRNMLAGCRALAAATRGDAGGWTEAAADVSGSAGAACLVDVGAFRLAIAGNELAEAERALRRAVGVLAAMVPIPLHRFAAAYARLRLAGGRPAEAARLLGFAHEQLRHLGPQATRALMSRYDSDLSQIAADLGSHGLAEAWSTGAAVPWLQMLAELSGAGHDTGCEPTRHAPGPTVSSIQS